MAAGGKRAGAGRKPGSTNLPKLRDYFTEAERKALAKDAKERAKTSDRVLVELVQQVFGKAAQAIVGDPDRPIPVHITGMTIVNDGTGVQDKKR